MNYLHCRIDRWAGVGLDVRPRRSRLLFCSCINLSQSVDQSSFGELNDSGKDVLRGLIVRIRPIV
jgi:hypothetical protein